MSYLGYGRLAGVLVVAAVAAVSKIGTPADQANYLPVEAEIFRIDRTCGFKITSVATRAQTSETSSCNDTDEFDKMRDDPARSRYVVGSAEIQLSYTAPTDGSHQTGTLKITGRDDEFYSWKAHDKVKILVDKTDLTKIKKL